MVTETLLLDCSVTLSIVKPSSSLSVMLLMVSDDVDSLLPICFRSELSDICDVFLSTKAYSCDPDVDDLLVCNCFLPSWTEI